MTEGLEVDRDDIISALRERISALSYENALLAAAVAKLQREATSPDMPALHP